MSITILPKGQRNDGRHNLGGGNPDDERPEPIGGPKLSGKKIKASQPRVRDWTDKTAEKFLHEVKEGGKGYHASQAADKIAGIFEEGAGANHELSRLEAREVAGRIRNDRVALGLTQHEADDLGNMIEAGPQT